MWNYRPQTPRYYSRDSKNGSWISILPSTINMIYLGFQEWRDSIFLRYGIQPPDLPLSCDDCNIRFYIYHNLYFKKGDFITYHIRKVCYGVTDLANTSLTPTCVYRNHLLHTCHTIKIGRSHPDVYYHPNNPPFVVVEYDKKLDILIRDLGHKGTYCIQYNYHHHCIWGLRIL